MNCTEKLVNEIIVQVSCTNDMTLLKEYEPIIYEVKYCSMLLQITQLRKEMVKKTQQLLSWKKKKKERKSFLFYSVGTFVFRIACNEYA